MVVYLRVDNLLLLELQILVVAEWLTEQLLKLVVQE
jgi:hypothetical protein